MKILRKKTRIIISIIVIILVIAIIISYNVIKVYFNTQNKIIKTQANENYLNIKNNSMTEVFLDDSINTRLQYKLILSGSKTNADVLSDKKNNLLYPLDLFRKSLDYKLINYNSDYLYKLQNNKEIFLFKLGDSNVKTKSGDINYGTNFLSKNGHIYTPVRFFEQFDKFIFDKIDNKRIFVNFKMKNSKVIKNLEILKIDNQISSTDIYGNVIDEINFNEKLLNLEQSQKHNNTFLLKFEENKFLAFNKLNNKNAINFAAQKAILSLDGRYILYKELSSENFILYNFNNNTYKKLNFILDKEMEESKNIDWENLTFEFCEKLNFTKLVFINLDTHLNYAYLINSKNNIRYFGIAKYSPDLRNILIKNDENKYIIFNQETEKYFNINSTKYPIWINNQQLRIWIMNKSQGIYINGISFLEDNNDFDIIGHSIDGLPILYKENTILIDLNNNKFKKIPINSNIKFAFEIKSGQYLFIAISENEDYIFSEKLGLKSIGKLDFIKNLNLNYLNISNMIAISNNGNFSFLYKNDENYCIKFIDINNNRIENLEINELISEEKIENLKQYWIDDNKIILFNKLKIWIIDLSTNFTKIYQWNIDDKNKILDCKLK